MTSMDVPTSLTTQPTPGNVVLCSPEWRNATGRVLHLINGEHYSGAERVQDLLALRLPEVGFQAGLACVKPKLFPDVRRAQRAPLYSVAMRSRFDLSSLKRLREIVRSYQYDVLHAHTPRTVMIGSILSRWTGLPLVYHVHSPVGRDSTRQLQNWFNGRIEWISLHNVRRMITVSSSLCDYMLSEGYSNDMLRIVPNGVPATESQRSSSLPTGEWTLGTVALFRPRKGTEVLIDALALLREQGKNVRVKAVGGFETPEYERQLKEQVARRQLVDHVEWTGFTENVNAELVDMDLFVLPSLFGEGLPMVVLEAMAAGVPVVGTRVEGVPEAIRDGHEGVLAEPADAADLARAIARIIDGEADWQTLRSSAIERHRDQFSDLAMASGVANVYRELLAKD